MPQTKVTLQNPVDYIAWELAVAAYGQNELVEQNWVKYLPMAHDVVEVLENPEVTWPMEI